MWPGGRGSQPPALPWRGKFQNDQHIRQKRFGHRAAPALLFVPEDQVDPVTETLPDHVGLECLPVDLDKEPWVFRRPRRQYDIGDPFPVLLMAKVETLLVEEDLPSKILTHY